MNLHFFEPSYFSPIFFSLHISSYLQLEKTSLIFFPELKNIPSKWFGVDFLAFSIWRSTLILKSVSFGGKPTIEIRKSWSPAKIGSAKGKGGSIFRLHLQSKSDFFFRKNNTQTLKVQENRNEFVGLWDDSWIIRIPYEPIFLHFVLVHDLLGKPLKNRTKLNTFSWLKLNS